MTIAAVLSDSRAEAANSWALTSRLRWMRSFYQAVIRRENDFFLFLATDQDFKALSPECATGSECVQKLVELLHHDELKLLHLFGLESLALLHTFLSSNRRLKLTLSDQSCSWHSKLVSELYAKKKDRDPRIEAGSAGCQGSFPSGVFIPPGIDLSTLPPCAKKRAKNILGLSASEIVILFYTGTAGTSEADLVQLFIALNQLSQHIRNVHVLIVGDVRNPGRVPHSALNSRRVGEAKVVFVNKCDPFVLPLVFAASDVCLNLGGCGTFELLISTIYAMANGAAVCVPDGTVEAWLVGNGCCGILLPSVNLTNLAAALRKLSGGKGAPRPSDVTGYVFNELKLSETIERLVDNSTERRRLGDLAQERVSKYLTIDYCAARYTKWWGSIINAKKTEVITDLVPLSRTGIAEDLVKRPMYLTQRGAQMLRSKSTRWRFSQGRIVDSEITCRALESAQKAASLEELAAECLSAASDRSHSRDKHLARWLHNVEWCLRERLFGVSNNPISPLPQ